jgi:hypothetical protein
MRDFEEGLLPWTLPYTLGHARVGLVRRASLRLTDDIGCSFLDQARARGPAIIRRR